MRPDHQAFAEALRRPLPPPRRVRKGPAERLRAALLALTGGHGAVIAHSLRPWASVTFTGARHTVELLFEGAAGIAAGEAFIDSLPDHEFTLPGHLVADAAIGAVDHAVLPAPRLRVTAELLLLEDN